MDPFQMVIGIVLIVTVGNILRAKYGVGGTRLGRNSAMMPVENDAENRMLKDEIRTLKDRIAVLERIATDNNRAVNLDREIEQLRDR